MTKATRLNAIKFVKAKAVAKRVLAKLPTCPGERYP
jgi:hypothetical protein